MGELGNKRRARSACVGASFNAVHWYGVCFENGGESWDQADGSSCCVVVRP